MLNIDRLQLQLQNIKKCFQLLLIDIDYAIMNIIEVLCFEIIVPMNFIILESFYNHMCQMIFLYLKKLENYIHSDFADVQNETA